MSGGELANLISRSLVAAASTHGVRTWGPSLEQALHRVHCRASLTPSLVARVIDSLSHRSLALGFFNWASQQPGFSHSSLSYQSLLNSLLSSPQAHFTALLDQVLGQVRSRNITLHPRIYRSVISSHISAGKPLHAFSIFNQVSVTSSKICYDDIALGPDLCNSLLASLSSEGHISFARNVFDRMIDRGVVLSTLGFGVFVWRFCRTAQVGETLSLLDEAMSSVGGVWGVDGSIVALLVVHGLCLEHKVQDAFWVLGELRNRDCKPDFMAYRIVAEALRLNGYVVDVGVALKKKRKLGVAPRAKDYREFLFALISEKRFWEAKELGEVIVGGNFPIEDDVLNALIGSVSVLYPSSALTFLDFMVGKERVPTLLTLSNLCSNLCKHGKIDDMLEVFQTLSSKEFFTDLKSYSVMVSFLCKSGRVKEAYEVIQVMKKEGLSPDVSLYNYIMEACCKEGLVRPAKRLWDEMFTSGCNGNLITYNILIKKFCDTGQTKEAQALFSHMLEKGIVPDAATYWPLFQVFCKEKDLEEALGIFRKHVQHDPLLARSILNPFIICLCKQGFYRAASELLCGLGYGIEQLGSHVILLKWLVGSGNVPFAIEHILSIRKNSTELLQEIYAELRAASNPSLSIPEPILHLLRAVEERLQVPVIS